ncbi:MAG: hypothetical protein ACJAYY_003097 [Paraglaciecola sp.]|jgi:hypothetical protein|uniref:hypothetical protein n=1 Tax=Polaribacter sp. TaxID=1920175 RepID=UPI003AD6A38F
MKNALSICFVLIISFSFAQENSSDAKEVLKNENNNAFSLIKNEAAKFFKIKEIVPVDFEKRADANEGKFSLKEIKNKSLTSLLSDLDKNTKAKFLIIEDIISSNQSLILEKSITIVANRKFINKLITDKIIQDDLINEAFTYRDRNIESYRNYPELVDLFNVKYTITEDLEVQTGDNIYDFINKPFKSELDRTLFNSLNLLAISF